MDQNDVNSPQAAPAAPAAQAAAAAPAVPADQAAPPPNVFQEMMNEDGEIFEHPEFLPPHGIDPAELPPYPDLRPGWKVPYTEAEAEASYVPPAEFVQKC